MTNRRRNFRDYIATARARHGEKFSPDCLAPALIPFFESGERIRVQLAGMDQPLTGTIGITTGWRPAFLLMRTTRSIGSAYTLSGRDRVLGRKIGRTYQPIAEVTR